MGEVVSLQSAFPQDMFRRSAHIQPGEDLKERYTPLFRGFETYELHKWIDEYRLRFDEALHDLVACIKCTGECTTGHGLAASRMYLGLCRASMDFNRGRPAFRVFRCPGVAERKEQLRRLYVSDREEETKERTWPSRSERQMPW